MGLRIRESSSKGEIVLERCDVNFVPDSVSLAHRFCDSWKTEIPSQYQKTYKNANHNSLHFLTSQNLLVDKLSNPKRTKANPKVVD